MPVVGLSITKLYCAQVYAQVEDAERALSQSVVEEAYLHSLVSW